MNFPKNIEDNLVFVDTFAKTHSIMEQFAGKNVRVAYSGGSDSDTVMWLLKFLGYDVTGVFFDTGLEYQATWKHLDYMRSCGFDIETIKAITPIPLSNKKYGSPFISKYTSQMIAALQRYGFDFQEDGKLSFDELSEKYPQGKSYLRWWCDLYKTKRYNISRNMGLKEFLIKEGVPFKISHKCCDGAKKLPIKRYAKEIGIDLMLLGIRKEEGGIRSLAYKNCFVPKKHHTYGMYFPLFWWSRKDKNLFDLEMDIKHSDCYEIYGLERTGCAGCPFGGDFEKKLEVLLEFEPKLYKGVNNIFGQSYDWTRKYKIFLEEMKSAKKI